MFKNPFLFQGRIRRTEYGLSIIIVVIWMIIFGILREVFPYQSTDFYFQIFQFIGVYFMICQSTKRCHDLGKSGYYQFIPFLNCRLFFSGGKTLPNIYGRSPKVKRLQSKKESFGSLYIKLEPILLKLDKERRVILVRLVLRRSMSIVLLLIYILYNINVEEETGEPLADWGVENISFWLIFILTHAFMHVQYPTVIDDYYKSFKKEIITPLVKLFDKSSVYKAKPNRQQRISMAKGFVESEIFGQWYPFNYQGELDDNVDSKVGGTVYNISDFVSSQIGNIKIEFSMLECGQHREANLIQEEDYTHIFEGLFYSVDFNKSFAGKTFLLVDVAQAEFGLIGQELQSVLGGNKELIRLENEEFEEQFVVYSDDQIEARYILSPTLMEKIVKFQNNCFGRIQMSFVENKLHIAIRYSYGMALFEPKFYTSIVDSNDIQEYYENLTWIGDLVKELNLNRKIWKKS